MNIAAIAAARAGTVVAACLGVALSIASCSGGTSPPSGGDVDIGMADAAGMDPGCTSDADCTALLPATSPANCAVGKCDVLQGKCAFVSNDADGDGHPAANCKAVGTGSIQAGDDCDDNDKTTYPGAPDTCDGRNHTCATSNCACTDGTKQACYTGPPPTRGVGKCADGIQLCASGSWGTCAGDIIPKSVDACDGTDANCDGNPNTGCPCQNGTTQSCYGAPAGTAGVGVCRKGTQTCAGAAWGLCVGAVIPSPRYCGGALDKDCNGKADNSEAPCQTCVVGNSMVCGAHPGFDGKGTCKAGSELCAISADGTSVGYLGCQGSVAPAAEGCGPSQADTNCTGISGDGAGCKAVYYILSTSNSFGPTGTQLLTSGATSEPPFVYKWQTIPVLTSGGDHRVERWAPASGGRVAYISSLNETAGARCTQPDCRYEGTHGNVVQLAGGCPVGWQSLVFWYGPNGGVTYLLKNDPFTSAACGAGGLPACADTTYCVPAW